MRPLVPPQTPGSVSASHRRLQAAVVPYSLDLILIDSALQHIREARSCMDDEDRRESHHYLHAAMQIVGELRSSLDVLVGRPFAANLDDLCSYMSRQLMAANVQNRTATLDEVSDLLREARTAWMMVSYV